MKSVLSLTVYALATLLTLGAAQAANLPIRDGVYVTKPQFCEDLRRGELEMIDFEVSKKGAAFSYPESFCVVAKVTKVRETRYSVSGDCNEFGDIWQSSFFLDVIDSDHIALDGQPHQLCSGSATSGETTALLDEWMNWNERCRGGSGNEASTIEACDMRADVAAKLEEANLCYGRESDASRADYGWHTCGPGSIHF